MSEKLKTIKELFPEKEVRQSYQSENTILIYGTLSREDLSSLVNLDFDFKVSGSTTIESLHEPIIEIQVV